MRRCLIILSLCAGLLLPGNCEERDRALVTYHLWLTYRDLPDTACPVGLPDSKFFLKGYSPAFGFSPLAVFLNETETDPFCSIRLRTEGFEELNPFKEILWRPNELESECQFKEDKKIKMLTAFINNETAGSTAVLSNSGTSPWKQEIIFYAKGTAIIPEDSISKKSVTVTCPQTAGFSALAVVFDRTILSEISFVQENDRYRIIAGLNIPAGSAAVVNFGAACAADARSAVTAAGLAAGKNIYEQAAEKEVFYNKLLSNIPRIYNTDVSTRKYYQTAYMLFNSYRREEFSEFAAKYIFEEKLKKLTVEKAAPWLYWKAYEFTGNIKYLETAVSNGESYSKPENKVLELYNQLVLEWAGSLIGKKPDYIPVKLKESAEIKDEQKVLYMLVNGESPKSIETEAKKLLNHKELKYPEIFFILDLLAKFDIKGLIPAFFEKELPFTSNPKERTLFEVMAYMDMYFKSSGLDFTRGNLYIQPFDFYKFRNIFNFRHKGNTLDIFYSNEGKYIDRILLDGQPVNSRLLYIPEADVPPLNLAGTAASSGPNATLSSNPQRKIEIQLSNWPSNPVLNSIKTNSWFKVFKCAYDEKNAVFNIDMETPPPDKFKAVISITKNTRAIKKVTVNRQDISKYGGIKLEFKEKGY